MTGREVILFFDKRVLLLKNALSEEEEYDLCLANMNGDLLLPLFVGDPVDSVVIPDVDLMFQQGLGDPGETGLILCIVTDKNIRLCISGFEA